MSERVGVRAKGWKGKDVSKGVLECRARFVPGGGPSWWDPILEVKVELVRTGSMRKRRTGRDGNGEGGGRGQVKGQRRRNGGEKDGYKKDAMV